VRESKPVKTRELDNTKTEVQKSRPKGCLRNIIAVNYSYAVNSLSIFYLTAEFAVVGC
jgi:hypothetical protein